MGKEKYLKRIELLFRKSPVVDANSISRIIRSKKQVKQYPKQLIRNLILRGKIKRLTKGYYTLHGDPSLAVFCFSPAYLGLQDALSIHSLWEQETVPVIVTTEKVRPGIRKILDTNVLIRRLNKKYFFGIEYVKQDNFYIPVSDIEKTFVDLIYFKQKLDRALLKNFRKRINIKKLKRYAKRYPKRTSHKILKLVC